MSDGMRRELVYLSSHATNHYFIPNWGIILENNIVVYITARFPGICVNCKCYCIYFFYLCQQLCSVHEPNNPALVL